MEWSEPWLQIAVGDAHCRADVHAVLTGNAVGAAQPEQGQKLLLEQQLLL